MITRRSPKSIGFMAALSMMLLVAACGRRADVAVEQEDVIPVKVVKIDPQDIRETLDYVGDIRAEEEAVIYPRASGKIIDKLKEDGSRVQKGDIIAYIDRDEVGFKFEKAPVESPLSGIIGRFYVDKGENVTPQTPIAMVVDMDRVEIILDIPEKYFSRIFLSAAAEVEVDAYPQEEFSGRVSKISPVIDLETRTVPVEITLDNPGHRLKSGMFADVSLIIGERKAVPVILKEAVMGREPDYYVYVVEGGRAVLRDVSLGIRQGPYYEVREGLKEGDSVVVMGQQRLYEGAPVRVEEQSL
ncbi:MAG: efflux RND transporter periplasmic adaptor subunit [Candidatus Omnitrophota bacterium]